ncbi:MAG: hydrogenase iron-sulfur subunit [Deltaproteobacteria bacterium]|nr:MAG: hydrogenase iron-sulfur subunit [Deltaproteobacteria bacterium]
MTATLTGDELTVALFYCHNTPGSGEHERRSLEKRFGGFLRLYPLACGGRLEARHLLRALEEFADAAFVITCPAGDCRYFEGNLRAEKRAQWVREIIRSVGLEDERVGFVMNSKEDPKPLANLAEGIMTDVARLGHSPVLRPQSTWADSTEKGEMHCDYR